MARLRSIVTYKSRIEKVALKNFAKYRGKHLCQSPFFITLQQPVTLLKGRLLAQVFLCEFGEIFDDAFFTEHLLETTSEI